MIKYRLLTFFSILSLVIQPWPSTSPTISEPAHTPSGQTYAILNEVMAKPALDSSAWVEILITRDTQRFFLPLIQQNNPQPAGSPTIIPIPAASPTALDLRGWQISNLQGQAYILPETLPMLQPETFVLVYFDQAGPGANDLNPADGKIVLHTPGGLGNIFSAAPGQAGLYRPGSPSPETIVDFVAWGGPDDPSAVDAVAAGLWTAGTAVSLENGLGDIILDDLLENEEAVGRYPGSPPLGAPAWANYPSNAITPGEPNPVQPVLFTIPEDMAAVEANNLSLAWRTSAGATGYRVLIDNNEDFSSPLVDQVVVHPYYQPNPPLVDGQYYWQVIALPTAINQGIKGAANLAGGYYLPITMFRLKVFTFIHFNNEKVLAINRVSQNKDSDLLGLDGAPEGDPTTSLPENAWDAPAPCTAPPCADPVKYMHGNMYCVRASICMMTSFYGGDLSMDRLSYHIIQEWGENTHAGTHDSNPDNDLGYNRGAYYPDEEDEALSWALQTTITTSGGKPTFSQIKDYIEADRPIMFRRPGHMMVINGYRETSSGDQFIHVLDPDQPPDFERWQDYSTQTIDGYWPGPAVGTARSEEPGVGTDSDNDGIMDFDETMRFFTNPFNPDSDNDWVPDKKDMREYIFNTSGDFTPRSSDQDGDGQRKERDNDNDQDTSPDGCEDTDFNGQYQPPAETDNFDIASHQACIPRFSILYPLTKIPARAGDPAGPQKILVQVSLAVPSGWELTAARTDFTVHIGGKAARVLATYPSGDTVYLVVAPPKQTLPGQYDLEAAYLSGTVDAQQEAVHYEKTPPNDEVVVIDRSGSMAGQEKMTDAKQAASAFVDFLNNGDEVGVVSFASSAGVDYPLTTINSSGIRTEAKKAIDALDPSGTTALGSGLLYGYNQLVEKGNPNHDWSMVLLSDGWENVAPYWAEVAPTISDIAINTVALGQEADQALLKSIAESTGGKYFYVEVNPATPGLAAVPEPTAEAPLTVAAYLNNRLADAYLAAGEASHDLQRLFDQAGPVSVTTPTILKVPVGELPEAIFSLSWNSPAGTLRMILADPDGKPVAPNAEWSGATHHILRVSSPKPGDWTVTLQADKPAQEYEFMLSGTSQTSLITGVGPDPDNLLPGETVLLYAILTDHDPISNATVQAIINGPMQITTSLYDDGLHGDGEAKDGVYANQLDSLTLPGSYSVKMAAAGTNNDNQTFLRYASTTLYLHPLATYVWDDDFDSGLSYQKLLEDHGWRVNLLELSEVEYADFENISLLIAGSDTGYQGKFNNQIAAGRLAQTPMNFLGLGQGGAALFQEFGLTIRYINTWISNNNTVLAVEPASSFWIEPHTFQFGEVPTAGLYPKPLIELGVYLPKPTSAITPIARELNDVDHYPLAAEIRNGQNYILWGYNLGPVYLTQDGRDLLVNLAFALK